MRGFKPLPQEILGSEGGEMTRELNGSRNAQRVHRDSEIAPTLQSLVANIAPTGEQNASEYLFARQRIHCHHFAPDISY